jgi:hypothetical protein
MGPLLVGAVQTPILRLPTTFSAAGGTYSLPTGNGLSAIFYYPNSATPLNRDKTTIYLVTGACTNCKV